MRRAPACVRAPGVANAACGLGHLAICEWLRAEHSLAFSPDLIASAARRVDVHQWLFDSWPLAACRYLQYSASAVVYMGGVPFATWWAKVPCKGGHHAATYVMVEFLWQGNVDGAAHVASELKLDTAALVKYDGFRAIYAAISYGNVPIVRWYLDTFRPTVGDLCPRATLMALAARSIAQDDAADTIVLKALGPEIAQWRLYWRAAVVDGGGPQIIQLAEALGVTAENSLEDIRALTNSIVDKYGPFSSAAADVSAHFGVA